MPDLTFFIGYLVMVAVSFITITWPVGLLPDQTAEEIATALLVAIFWPLIPLFIVAAWMVSRFEDEENEPFHD